MRSRFLSLGSFVALALAVANPVPAQIDQSRLELANLREEVRGLTQRLGELAMNVEQLTRENNALQTRTGQNFVTLEQLNRSLAELNRVMQGALLDQKRDVLQTVAGQIERLGKQTNAALDALAKNQATRPAVPTTFADDFPKEGINYTVQTGDSLSNIAKKTGAKMSDIINANKITDPTKIRVGQTLFIPQGK